jgi:hypothetical protein
MRGYEYGRKNKRSKGQESCYITIKFFNILTDILHNILCSITMEEHFVNSIESGSLIKLQLIITNKDDDLTKGDNTPTA